MGGAFFSQDTFRYAPLPRNVWRQSRNSPHTSLSSSHVLVGAFVAVIAMMGFFLGRMSVADHQHGIPSLSTKPRVFHYNRIFGEAPSNASDRAWESLFPQQGGFFKHPQIAPKRSAFAVFHQLHCLDSIRKGYWEIHAAATTGRQIKDEDIPFMSSPPHLRHCIDLIRNSLMCQPDLTVELKEEELGGVRGFGTEHQCLDWGELIDWTSKWETYKQDPPSHKDKQHSGHDHHM